MAKREIILGSFVFCRYMYAYMQPPLAFFFCLPVFHSLTFSLSLYLFLASVFFIFLTMPGTENKLRKSLLQRWYMLMSGSHKLTTFNSTCENESPGLQISLVLQRMSNVIYNAVRLHAENETCVLFSIDQDPMLVKSNGLMDDAVS